MLSYPSSTPPVDNPGDNARNPLRPKEQKPLGVDSSSVLSASNAVGKVLPSGDKKKSYYVPDRVPYFLMKLTTADEAWSRVSIAAVVRLAKRYDMDVVVTALSFIAVSPPTLTGSAYGYLEATAKGLYEAKAGAV